MLSAVFPRRFVRSCLTDVRGMSVHAVVPGDERRSRQTLGRGAVNVTQAIAGMARRFAIRRRSGMDRRVDLQTDNDRAF